MPPFRREERPKASAFDLPRSQSRSRPVSDTNSPNHAPVARSFMIEIRELSARHEADESPERRATSSYALAPRTNPRKGVWAIAANAASLRSGSDEEALGCARPEARRLGCICS